jgi:hypothetical protein
MVPVKPVGSNPATNNDGQDTIRACTSLNKLLNLKK